jgi:DNA-directed RNA polymerase specialized sigma24 family protein
MLVIESKTERDRIVAIPCLPRNDTNGKMEIMMKAISEVILEDVDGYLITQAKKLMYGQQDTRYKELHDLEVDELTQRVRIKFWKMLEKGLVVRPYSYVRRIVYSEFIDMKRQEKQLLPLPGDEEEAVCSMQSLEDPADEIIKQMEFSTFLRHIVQMIIDLPPRQQRAMIYLLWDQIDDPVQLHTIFAEYSFDIQAIPSSFEKTERHAMLASLSVARQKLAKSRERDCQSTNRVLAGDRR